MLHNPLEAFISVYRNYPIQNLAKTNNIETLQRILTTDLVNQRLFFTLQFSECTISNILLGRQGMIARIHMINVNVQKLFEKPYFVYK